jgi:hypothetical protein
MTVTAFIAQEPDRYAKLLAEPGWPFSHLRRRAQGIRLAANRTTNPSLLGPYAFSLKPFHDIALRRMAIPGESLLGLRPGYAKKRNGLM